MSERTKLEDKTVDELRAEVESLREAFLRTYAANEGLRKGCRVVRDAVLGYSDDAVRKDLMSSLPEIPEVDEYVKGLFDTLNFMEQK